MACGTGLPDLHIPFTVAAPAGYGQVKRNCKALFPLHFIGWAEKWQMVLQSTPN